MSAPESIEAALAGPDPAETLTRTPQAPAGEMFRSADDRLAIDPSAGDWSDREAGASLVSIQLQETVGRKLETLSAVASRLRASSTPIDQQTPVHSQIALATVDTPPPTAVPSETMNANTVDRRGKRTPVAG